MDPSATEIETKLDLHPSVVLPALAVKGVRAEARDPQHLVATYFDTEDLRLIRAGATLRHRPEDDGLDWQVKLPLTGNGEGIRRDERAYAGAAGTPPAEAVSQVVALSRGAPLRPVATIDTARTPLELVDPAGAVVGEIDDDLVTGTLGEMLVARFREVEVETADDDLRREVVGVLRDAGAEPTDNRPKLVRVLGPRATEPPDLVVSPLGPPDPSIPIRDVVSRALLVDVRRLVRHDPGTRRGEDIEELHQMRVATRRLRATLRTYRPVLDEAWARALADELRPLARALGEVRDLDVMTDRVDGDLTALAERMPVDAAAAEALRDHLAGRRRSARDALLDHLDDPSHLALLDRLLDAGTNPVCTDPGAPAGPALSPLVRAAWRRVAKAERRGEHLHLVRLRVKRFRYAADAVVPAFGKPARRLSKVAGRAQDVLGVLQDADVAIEAHQRVVGDVGPGPAYVLGLLSGRALERRADALRAWPDAWRALRKPRLRAFLDG